MSTDAHRSDRVGRRAGTRIAVGILVGPLIGGALGLLLGSIVFGTWSAETPLTEESHPEPFASTCGTGSTLKRCLIAAQRPNVPGALRVTRRRHVPSGSSSQTASAEWLVMSRTAGRTA